MADARLSQLFQRDKIRRFFSVNSDIFLRTLCVIGVMSFFTSRSAVHSDHILAVNTILLQFFLTYSFFIDGFAYSAEALVGKHYGSGDRREVLSTVRSLFKLGVSVSLVVAAVFAMAGDRVMYLLTDNADVIDAGQPYMIWVKLVPLVSVLAFLWDGVYIGATATRQMRNSLFLAAAVFFAAFYSMPPAWGNHGLWLSFMLFLISRGLFQTFVFKRTVLLRRN